VERSDAESRKQFRTSIQIHTYSFQFFPFPLLLILLLLFTVFCLIIQGKRRNSAKIDCKIIFKRSIQDAQT
jgi:hypothetical protein